MKKEEYLGRRKNTFEKQKVFVGFCQVIEFRVDPAGRSVYCRPIIGSDFE
jgi:hypothetical protein